MVQEKAQQAQEQVQRATGSAQDKIREQVDGAGKWQPARRRIEDTAQEKASEATADARSGLQR